MYTRTLLTGFVSCTRHMTFRNTACNVTGLASSLIMRTCYEISTEKAQDWQLSHIEITLNRYAISLFDLRIIYGVMSVTYGNHLLMQAVVLPYLSVLRGTPFKRHGNVRRCRRVVSLLLLLSLVRSRNTIPFH